MPPQLAVLVAQPSTTSRSGCPARRQLLQTVAHQRQRDPPFRHHHPVLARHVIRRLQRIVPVARAGALLVDPAVAHDAIKPGIQPRAIAQMRRMLQGTGTDILHQVATSAAMPGMPDPRSFGRVPSMLDAGIRPRGSPTPDRRDARARRFIPARATAAACRPCGAAAASTVLHAAARHGQRTEPQLPPPSASAPSCQANTSSSHASSMAAGQGNSLRPRDRAATRSSMHCRTEVAQPVPHPVPEAAADEPRRCVQGMEVAVPVHEDERTDA